jgi:hypothetical protein
MDLTQMYNQSAMLHDALRSHANQFSEGAEKNKFEQLAKEQQHISESLKPKQA